MRDSSPDPSDRERVYAEFARKRLKLNPRPNEIPGVLPVRSFLGRSQDVAAALMTIHAYSTGLQFHLIARSRAGHPLIPTRASLGEAAGVPVVPPPAFTVTLANGAEAVPLDHGDAFRRLDEFGSEPVLIGWTGGGTTDRWDGHYWLTPDPHSGLTVRFSWPHFGLGTTEIPVPEHQLREAAASVVELWPWDPTADVR